MQDNNANTGGEDQAQGAAAPPRIIWRNGKQFVIDNLEPDGIIRLCPLRFVPTAFFNSGIHLALPTWAVDNADIMADAALQNCVLLDESIAQRREASMRCASLARPSELLAASSKTMPGPRPSTLSTKRSSPSASS